MQFEMTVDAAMKSGRSTIRYIVSSGSTEAFIQGLKAMPLPAGMRLSSSGSPRAIESRE